MVLALAMADSGRAVNSPKEDDGRRPLTARLTFAILGWQSVQPFCCISRRRLSMRIIRFASAHVGD